MADASVRTAEVQDAAAIARVQASAWRAAYGRLWPADVLADLDSPDGAERWRQAVAAPPSPRHRVLVALAGPEVVGYAVTGPSDDSDLDDAVDAEIAALSVLPDRQGQGHGSRLVNAAVDHLCRDGFRRGYVWLADAGGADDDLLGFLTGAGWGPDGVRRVLDLDDDGRLVVSQVRLVAEIGATS